jgi:spermidine/putrescine transport system permease protein
MSAIENTIIIALIAASVATLLGTVAAIGIHNMRGRGK